MSSLLFSELLSREVWRVNGSFRTVVVVGALLLQAVPLSWGASQEILRPRVPRDQIEAARAVTKPLPVSGEMIAKGKVLFEGKAFCKACHGTDGKGLGGDIAPGSLKGPLPRNFTDKAWQAARTDGELVIRIRRSRWWQWSPRRHHR